MKPLLTRLLLLVYLLLGEREGEADKDTIYRDMLGRE